MARDPKEAGMQRKKWPTSCDVEMAHWVTD